MANSNKNDNGCHVDQNPTKARTADVTPDYVGIMKYFDEMAKTQIPRVATRLSNIERMLGGLFSTYTRTRSFLVDHNASPLLLEILDNMPAGTWKPKSVAELLR